MPAGTRNADGLVSAIASVPYSKTYAYDARHLPTSIADTQGGATQTYSYDALGRLVGSTLGGTTWSYGYDANGNRTASSRNGTPVAYRYDSVDDYDTHDLMMSAGTWQFGTDAAGNMAYASTTAGGVNTTYDGLGRVVSSSLTASSGRKSVTTTTAFQYAANGLRMQKGSTRFAYDQQGHLIGEYATNGAVQREYVYLGDELVAMTTPTASYFVQSDHLGTPRTMTDTSNAVVWRWEGEPFGDDPPTGSVALNARFPGQYYDGETGLFFNNARYYHPSIGRYISPDPIGLAGGMNVYGYVGGNPVSRTDPTGLDAVVVLYPGASGFGHVGVGVNTNQTQGLYPAPGSSGFNVAIGAPNKGALLPDNRTPIETITVPLSPAQDQILADYLRDVEAFPRNYSLGSKNCATTVAGGLRATGLNPPNSIRPSVLMNYLRHLYY